MAVTTWRRSRWVRALASLPWVRDLPMARLELGVARLRRVHRLGRDLVTRAGAFLRTARRLAERSQLGAALRPRAVALFASEGFGRRAIEASGCFSVSDPAAELRRAGPAAGRGGPAGSIPIAVYASARGNFFFREMADLLAHGLAASGEFDARRRDETAEPDADAREHLVVAPHEFHALGAGRRFAGASYRDFRRRCTLFGAEQPGTKHFDLYVAHAVEARLSLDLSPGTAAILRELGVPAAFFPPGWAPGFAAFGDPIGGAGEAFEKRPIDVAFNGVWTQRRSRFFAERAAFFAARHCALWLPSPALPLGAEVPSTLETDAACSLSRRAKILLNVHRSDLPYFAWHRLALRGFWHGTLVVSEPCCAAPGFEAGVHYLEAPLAEIPELLAWLLDSSDGRARAEVVRRAGFDALRERFDLRDWARALAARYRGD